jgi:rRNA maturation protein Nop10
MGFFKTKHDGKISEYRNTDLNMQLYDNLVVNNAFKPVAHVTEYKVHPRTGTEADQRYSSTLSLTSVLDGGEWLTPRPGRFTPGKTRYPLYRRLGGQQSRSGRVRKISSPPGFDPADRPARSESLYRLRHRVYHLKTSCFKS